LQTWWAGTLLEQLMRLFRMRLDVAGVEEVARGPFLLFIRHSSIADTLLASLLVAKRHAVRLRYILKRELLWDPCLDVVGNRLPNVFVDRGATDSAREIERVSGLAKGLGSRDGVLIYPEGTRFSAAKRQRVLERFESDGLQSLHAYASSLRRSLPPRLGGPLALLRAAPGADVVFCAHVGFEPVSTLGEVWSGGLFGATVRVRFRRVPREEVPSGRAAQEAWLQREWAEQDQWLAAHARTDGEP
jgi:1-acyl-sn-glycerol-3-phosphate acyltransferase